MVAPKSESEKGALMASFARSRQDQKSGIGLCALLILPQISKTSDANPGALTMNNLTE